MEEYRGKVRELIEPLAEDAAKEVELGIFNAAIQHCEDKQIVRRWKNPLFREVYKMYWRKTDYNLRRNPELLKQYAPQKIAELKHQDMAFEKWADIVKRRQLKEEHANKEIAPTTSLFTCQRCKSKNCDYTQMQIRSADEPMTTFVRCIDCHFRFRC
jgi:DNA-directed RNA polymerase subunit M/transcription elongation factor TFIIS